MKRISVCVGTDLARNVRVRLSLIICDPENPDAVISERYHSLSMRPGDDISACRQSIESDIARPYSESGIPGAPWPKIPDEEWAEVEQIVSILHTPERVVARIAKDEKVMKFTVAQAVRTK